MKPSEFAEQIVSKLPTGFDLEATRKVVQDLYREPHWHSFQRVLINAFESGLTDSFFTDYGMIECLERKRWFEAGQAFRNRMFPQTPSRYMDTR